MRPRHYVHKSLSLPLVLFVIFLTLLWLAGGASRADALGQVVVRAGAWTAILVGLLMGKHNIGTVRPVLFLVVLIFLLPVIQLIPLPPSLWSALPYGDLLPPTEQPPIWRPMTIVPSATLNSLSSLVIPAATLMLFTQLNEKERSSITLLLLIFIVTAVLLGIIQISGKRFDNPFINDLPGHVSGIFANRNHFALLVAMGCVLAPVWAFSDRTALRWRGPLAAALVLLFLLTVIAIGSRSGLLLVALALIISTTIIGKRIKHRLRHSPTWLFPALALTALLVVVSFISISFFAGRVEAVDRVFELEVGKDLRIRSQPTIWKMIWDVMPFGAGLGTFDPLFRMYEPVALLTPRYFNQAHNDYLGIALDAGLPGLILLAAATAWWFHSTVRVVRATDGEEVMLARLGSALLLLIFVASATDYPARTPIIMMIAVIAGAWLANGSWVCRRSTLPQPLPDV